MKIKFKISLYPRQLHCVSGSSTYSAGIVVGDGLEVHDRMLETLKPNPPCVFQPNQLGWRLLYTRHKFIDVRVVDRFFNYLEGIHNRGSIVAVAEGLASVPSMDTLRRLQAPVAHR